MAEFIREVEFIKSSPDLRSCPTDGHPEYAFVGRSNVGKSSLINFLTGQKRLAKTSGQPGRTQLINHFRVDNAWYLVDLPGYGYAKISKSQRARFLPLIYEYLEFRTTLACLFLLIDSRHEPQKKDLEFMRWLGEKQVPFVICFTKTDKLSGGQLNTAVRKYKETLSQEWESLPQLFFSSTLDNRGREEILGFIAATNAQISQDKPEP